MTRAARPRRANYGNWIRRRIIARFLVIGGLLIAAGFLLEAPWHFALWAVATVPLLLGSYLSYLYIRFAAGLQRRLWDAVIGQLDWNGEGCALDVGTGQGAVAITLAEKYPLARVVGVDLWAADWEYSKAACERNAQRRCVAGRVCFQHASAAKLPYADATFDAVVSHFVFHEVKDGASNAVKEGLRVLKPGGAFCFQDMFFDPKFYGETFTQTVRSWNLADVQLVRLDTRMTIPRLMRDRRVLGAAGLLYGRK